jgi:hypothetical protein
MAVRIGNRYVGVSNCDKEVKAMAAIDVSMAIAPVWTGVIATAVLDVWANVLYRVFRFPVTNWGLVGRWVRGLPFAIYRRSPISGDPSVPHEAAIGWFTHYLVGIVYAFAYFSILGAASVEPGLRSAMLFGLVTVLAPWLVLQPGLGLGFFATGTAKPNVTRALNLIAHGVFGVGLYIGWSALFALWP